jgi:hypothetical protein
VLTDKRYHVVSENEVTGDEVQQFEVVPFSLPEKGDLRELQESASGHRKVWTQKLTHLKRKRLHIVENLYDIYRESRCLSRERDK